MVLDLAYCAEVMRLWRTEEQSARRLVTTKRREAHVRLLAREYAERLNRAEP